MVRMIDADGPCREKARRELHKNSMSSIEQILEATSHKTAALRSPTSHFLNHLNKMDKTRDTAGEVITNS